MSTQPLPAGLQETANETELESPLQLVLWLAWREQKRQKQNNALCVREVAQDG